MQIHHALRAQNLCSFISLVKIEGDLNSTVPCSRLGVIQTVASWLSPPYIIPNDSMTVHLKVGYVRIQLYYPEMKRL